MQDSSKVNVLISPLDWGIGHATRCVPVINELLKKNCNVIIASNGRSEEFLKKEYPLLKHISLNAYNIKYTKSGSSLVFKVVLQIPRILKAIVKEHHLLKRIVENNNINLIISDNRYGLWHKKVYSVFITHQLMIKMPVGFSFAEKIIHKIIGYFISKFDECWIPDYHDADNLSGDLSHKYKNEKNNFFIGPLSRFSNTDLFKDNIQKQIDILFLLSGPEPQRTIFETLIMNQVKNSSYKVVIVRGVTEKCEEEKLNENTVMYSHLSTEKMSELIDETKIVVARSGYSTVMDLLVLNAIAVLVPTPGQTEQEYLAAYLVHKKLFYSISQNKFNINAVTTLLDNPLPRRTFIHKNCEILTKRIDKIAENIEKK